MNVGKKIKMAAIEKAVQAALAYLEKDPENNALKVMDLVDKFCPDGWYNSQRKLVREALESKGHWYQLTQAVYALDPGVRKAFFQNFMINASLKGSIMQNEVSEKYNCNAPWAILMDPTSACNLKCKGCWAAEYGNQLNLTLEDMDSIIRQGKELGCFMYIYTGGEPLVRKKDIITLCERHPECEFLSFTNGTLIDEDFCKEMLRVKNFVPAISVEGFEEANDDRRGQGVYEKVMHACELLKAHKLPFGHSICYTSKNYKDVTSEKFFDQMIDKGALFAWYFHYMPVGKGAVPELLLSPEQRTEVLRALRHFRNTKPLFALDFQNDGQYVGGCIAGGRRYFHINAKGACEPCVFVHYSDVNIHDKSLLDVLRSPLFQAYHDNQPFNHNHLRPCPMLENPEKIEQLVKETGAVNTDYQNQESVEELTAKTHPYADRWAPVAEELWKEVARPKDLVNYDGR
ncbi:MAG: radical SAM protein [Eubacterium sp.]|nr:radical SAM protein [Eubacterium sp.]